MGARTMTSAVDAVNRLTRWVDDFPIEGVRFADLTPVLADQDGFASIVEALAAADIEFDLVAGLDARGFLLAGAVAIQRGCGVLAVRKAGKLPPPVLKREFALEYGTAAFEIPASQVDLQGKRILIVDDVLATGGTLAAAAGLLADAGATVVGLSVILELTFLGGRDRVPGLPLSAVVAL